MTSEMPSQGSGARALKRTLSLPLVTFYGLGTILGAGIYALVGKVSGAAGMLAPLAFLLAAVLASFTAFTFAELCGRYPKSAGEAIYVERGFGRRWLATVIGLLVVVTGIVSAAAIANAFVGYLHEFVEVPRWLVLVGLILALGALAAWGISESITAAMIITLIEIGGLLLVMWVAREALANLPSRLDEFAPGWSLHAWTGIGLGAFLAFYAFIGFEDMVNVAEEVRQPEKTMPWAIGLALLAATILYVVIALTAVLALDPQELGASEAPLADVYRKAGNGSPAVITAISLIAVTNGALVQIIMASRVLYGMSRRGWLPAMFGHVHPWTRTPVRATVCAGASVLALAIAFPLVTLAEATTAIMLVVFGTVNVALLRLKRREAAPQGVRTFPLWIPLAGAVTSAALLSVKALELVGVISTS